MGICKQLVCVYPAGAQQKSEFVSVKKSSNETKSTNTVSKKQVKLGTVKQSGPRCCICTWRVETALGQSCTDCR